MSTTDARDRESLKSPPSSAPRVIVVGGGPGGVATALLLASRGFEVDLYEKQDRLGGRTAAIVDRGYKFDIGPTFLMMKQLLDRIFEEAGKNSSDYLDFLKLDPMYQVRFGSETFSARDNTADTRAEIERLFPGYSAGLDEFMRVERGRFAKLAPALQCDFSSIFSRKYASVLPALPHLSLGRSVHDTLSRYFPNRDLALLFSFQTKYLGMSAWECPGAFAMLSYLEHEHGVYHTMGGLSEIPRAMGKAARELGARIHLGAPVRQLLLNGREVIGVELESGEEILADRVVVNADFGHAMSRLVPPGVLRKYTPEKLDGMKYSCSTFMMHLGVEKLYDLPHHLIVLAEDYRKNVDEIFQSEEESSDISFYVRNASINDPTLAPEGKSSLYILVPTPNLNGSINWEETHLQYRRKVLDAFARRLGITDLEQHIEVEHIFTPKTWESDLDVFKGATFNLSHCLSQMAYNRPHNQFEELKNCYLVGGGTHPGSGLPTIFESARISSNLISDSFGLVYRKKEVAV